jgi:UV excision repair protein RAD23
MPASSAPVEGSEGSAEADPGMAGAMGGVDLGQIRQRLLQDPNYLQQFLQELQVANPQLYQVLQQNPQALLQLLMGGMGGMGGGHGRPRSQGIQVTPEEKAAIDRVSLRINF